MTAWTSEALKNVISDKIKNVTRGMTLEKDLEGLVDVLTSKRRGLHEKETVLLGKA